MNYNPDFLLRSGHLNTIYPTLFRKQVDPLYHRLTIDTEDGDFLHVDCLFDGNKRIAIMCHGLEGSSRSKYIIGTSGILSENQWDTAALNFRGCSEEMNNCLRMYHSGETTDLHTVFEHFSKDYDEIALIGFSLGGNVVLKYCGERGSSISEKIICCAGVSVPTQLESGSVNIGKASNWIYEKKFLDSLRKKMNLKHAQFPDHIDLGKLNKIKKLYDFDDVFTGPIHGFKDAKDYYTRSSSARFLPSINIGTLIINALDDPFLPEACYPYKEAEQNKNIELLTPKHGGHVGFVLKKQKYYWAETVISNFLNQHSSNS